jgi:predicted nucleic acid-binding protein
MVLVDTSVWIAYFRQPQSRAALALSHLLETSEVCTCGLVEAELLPGIRKSDRGSVREYMASLRHVEIPPDIWQDVAAIQEQALGAGAGPFSLPDLVIAAVAIRNRVQVFTLDRHFEEIQTQSDLSLWRPLEDLS